MTLEEINDESLRLQREELRRRYAMAALTGLLANPTINHIEEDLTRGSVEKWVTDVSKSCFVFADKMLEREKL